MSESEIVATRPQSKSSSQAHSGGSAMKEIAFIDPAVSDVHVLLAGLRPDVEPILLDAAEPAPRQMARALAGRRGLDAIHVIAHGAPGEVSFAAGKLSSECLDEPAADLAKVGHALEQDGALLLWSCHTGAGARGTALLQGLASATGARVAASTRLVGAASHGGSWELDGRPGRGATRAPLSAEGAAAYAGILASATGSTTTDLAEYTNYAPSGSSYMAYLSVWGGASHTQDLLIYDATFPNNCLLTFNWSGSASTIQGFAAIDYGNYDGSAVGVPIASCRVSHIDTLSATFNLGWTGATAGYDIILDLFLTTAAAAPGTSGTQSCEVEAFLHTPAYSQYYINSVTQLGTFTSSGITWQVAVDPAGPSGSDYLFAPANYADVTVGTIDILAMLNFLVTCSVPISSSLWFNGIAIGQEAENGAGTFTVGAYAVDYVRGTDATASGSASVIMTPSSTGLIGLLNFNQQLELIYIAYFNRAADNGGFTFWGGQNVQAQAAGQSASLALTNIANSFTPQPETDALYPFLATPNLNLNTPAGQTGLSTFITSLYQNLFGHAPDAGGEAYWVGQITSGAVGLGAAALAIANGATGTDANEVLNKIAVAVDFTTKTGAAGLGETASLPSSFLATAPTALSGVDGTTLNDASVTAGMNATTAYISGLVTVTQSNLNIDPGAGNHTIQFLGGTSADTLVLHTGGVDQVYGFDPSTDVLDLRSLLSGAGVNLNGNMAALSSYLTIADQGTDALVSFDPTGHGGGSTVAVLHGLGSTINSVATLIADHAVQIA